LQLIKQLLRLDNIFYIAKNFKKYSKENRFLRKQDNLFSATNNTNNFTILITKITITIQIKNNINNK